jgi:hypothetical protein
MRGWKSPPGTGRNNVRKAPPEGADHSSTRPILTSSELEPLYVTELLTGRVVALRLEGAEASSRAVPRAARKHAR